MPPTRAEPEASAAITSARSLSATKLTRRKFASQAGKSNCCARSSSHQAQNGFGGTSLVPKWRAGVVKGENWTATIALSRSTVRSRLAPSIKSARLSETTDPLFALGKHKLTGKATVTATRLRRRLGVCPKCPTVSNSITTRAGKPSPCCCRCALPAPSRAVSPTASSTRCGGLTHDITSKPPGTIKWLDMVAQEVDRVLLCLHRRPPRLHQVSRNPALS
jgi:hypothetical protein